MCGIVGYVGKKPAKNFLIKGLTNLEYRGYDSCGISTIEDSKFEISKSIKRVSSLNDVTKKNLSNIGIAHTRWATHGMPSVVNSHPHVSYDGNICVVHNGIIENYSVLKGMLLNEGFTFKSSTDSEVIPNLILYNYRNLKEEKGRSFATYLQAVKESIEQLQGSFALGILCLDFPDKIVCTKKDSPLVVASGDDGMFVCSDINSISEFADSFYILEDYEVAVLGETEIRFKDKDLKDCTKEALVLEKTQTDDSDISSEYMLKEIFEQPQAVKNTIDYYLNNPIDFDGLDLSGISSVYMVACGTAMHAAQSCKYLFEDMLHIPCFVDIASEFRYRNPLVDDKTLCIYISQSGETADTIAALKLSNEKGCKTIAISNVFESTITRYADYTLYTKAGPEIAVASTKAYTCQITLLYILALSLAKKTNKITEETFNSMIEDLTKIPTLIENILNSKQIKDLKKFAKKVIKEESIYFIGRLIDEVASKEGALKLKEISYIHAESYPSGELKHGAIALIENGVTVISTLTDEKVADKTLSNIEEVITRGAKIFAITSLDLNKDFELTFKIPKTNLYLSPILSIIPQQLFAFYVAKYKGYDIDKPRNLAKSVTVE